MTWRLHPHRWPNGRHYWTVENRETGECRVGRTGNPSNFYDRGSAKAEANRLNGKARRMPTAEMEVVDREDRW